MLSDLDRRIIARTCEDLGDALDPYAALADELCVPVETLLDRLRYFREQGMLRRFGAVLRHQQAGFTANGLSVWAVAEEEIDRIGTQMAGVPEISHCYQRPALPGWPYTLYGMIHGHSRDECVAIAARVSAEIGITDYRILFSVREFKKTSMVYGNAGN